MGIKGWGFVLLATSLMGVTAKADWWPKDEDYKVVNKVINIVGHSCVREKQARTPKVYMAYLRGSPIDALNAPEAGERWKWMMTKIAEERHYNLQIETAHHTWWRSICREIKNQKPDTTVLVGHSYGTSGISKVAGCLQEANMKVDSLLTISSYDMLAGVDVTNVPINVAENLNFWTNSSTPGYDNHVAINPAVTFVRNILAEVNDGSWGHLKVAVNLVPLLALQSAFYAEHRVEHLKVPDIFDTAGLDDRLDEFKPCL